MKMNNPRGKYEFMREYKVYCLQSMSVLSGAPCSQSRNTIALNAAPNQMQCCALDGCTWQGTDQTLTLSPPLFPHK